MENQFPPEKVQMMHYIIDEMMPVHRYLGITLKEIDTGYALLAFPFREELVGDPRTQRWHGGMISALLDSAGGAAAITTLGSEDDQCSSIDLRIDYLEAGKPMDLLAEGRIVRGGNSVIFTDMKAWHPETGVVVAQGRAVYRVKRVAKEN